VSSTVPTSTSPATTAPPAGPARDQGPAAAIVPPAAAPTQAPTAAAPAARLHRVLPASMWSREWLLTLARPRSVVLKLAMPLLLGVPLVLGHAPTFWAGMLLTVLVAMTGAVGSGVSLARARSGGLLARLAVVPRPPAQVIGAWVLAAAAVDTVQMLPVALVVIATGASPLPAVALLACIPAVVLLTNTLGCALSLLADSPGEVLLDVVVVLAPLLFLGGLFTGVPRDGWRWIAARIDPFAYLHSAFVGALGGTPTFSAGDVLLTAVVSVAALAALSRALLARG
jgi:ABC-2 type transporter